MSIPKSKNPSSSASDWVHHTIRFPKPLYSEIEKLAVSDERSVNYIVVKLIERALKELK